MMWEFRMSMRRGMPLEGYVNWALWVDILVLMVYLLTIDLYTGLACTLRLCCIPWYVSIIERVRGSVILVKKAVLIGHQLLRLCDKDVEGGGKLLQKKYQMLFTMK